MKKTFLILLAFTAFSCGKNFGTNTGNPDQQNQEAPEPACGEGKRRCLATPVVLQTAGLIAKKINLCLGGDGTNLGPTLFDSIYNQTGLSNELPIFEKN